MTNNRQAQNQELTKCDQEIAALISKRDQYRSQIAALSGQLRALRTKRQRLATQGVTNTGQEMQITLDSGDSNSDHNRSQVVTKKFDALLGEVLD